MRRISRSLLVVLSASSAFAACGGETGPIDPALSPLSVARVELSPLADTVYAADTTRVTDRLQLTAAIIGQNGRPIPQARAIWRSEDESIAVVDETGLVRPRGLGTVRIVASAGKLARATIVVAPAVSRLSITPSLDTLQVGTPELPAGSRRLEARAVDRNGALVTGTRLVWSSSSPEVATVDSSGLITAVSTGTTTVTASAPSAGVSQAATIVVAVPSVTGIGRLREVTAGGDFSCGTTDVGRLYCWGRDDLVQLGFETARTCFDLDPDVDSPIRCELTPREAVTGSLRLRTVSAGGSFACGLDADGRAHCWGNNYYGQLGRNSTGGTREGELPGAVATSERFDALSAGLFHACALTSAGSAYCWGSDSLGQLGDRRTVNSTTPIPVFGSHAFRSISAGGYHTCGVLVSGDVLCWGDNRFGQIGNGNIGGFVDQPASAVPGGPYSSVSAGLAHSCAITASGQARCWGDNRHGQLGLGRVGDTVATPAPVAGALPFTAIRAGGYRIQAPVYGTSEDGPLLPLVSRSHTCALTSSGAAYCWGDNFWRQSGNEGSSSVSVPNLVPDQPAGGFTTLSLGFRHACAFGADGEAWCWGSNVHGALGNGLQAAGRHTPQQVVRPR